MTDIPSSRADVLSAVDAIQRDVERLTSLPPDDAHGLLGNIDSRVLAACLAATHLPQPDRGRVADELDRLFDSLTALEQRLIAHRP
jgi:hypothetical protein